jgi:hypothetical protein
MKRNRRAAVKDLWLKTLRDEKRQHHHSPERLARSGVAVAGSVCRRRRPRACEAVSDQSAGAALARSPDVESRARYPCRAEGREDYRRAVVRTLVRGLQRQPPEQCQLRSHDGSDDCPRVRPPRSVGGSAVAGEDVVRANEDGRVCGVDDFTGRTARLLGSNGKLSTPRMKLVFISFGSPAMKSGIWRYSSRNSDRSIDLARWVPRQ